MDEVSNMLSLVADRVSAMEATSPEVLRAVKACHALRCCGTALRPQFEASFATTRIQCFWSHSWANHQGKMLSLLFLYNHTAAVIFSTLGALVAATLFAVGWLPGPAWEEHQDIWVSPRGFWATVLGTVIYFSVLQLWRPQQSVFVDVMCINQEDPDAKLQGLLSMGAFLKHSDSMIVLWDASYTRRLWCVFELAAFLRSRPAGARGAKLYVRPLILGPCSVLLTFSAAVIITAIGWLPEQYSLAARMAMWASQVLVLLVGLCAIITVTRGYFRALDQMRSELRTFSLDKTQCFCCSSDHMAEDGTQISICDRTVLYKCIRTWYGDLDSFEEVVRSDVLKILLEELPSQFLTYRHCITAAIPFFWFNLDSFAAGMRHLQEWQSPRTPASRLLRGAAWWLGVVPALFVLGMRLSCAMRKKRRNAWCDAFVTFLIILCIIVSFLAVIQLEQLNFYIFRILFLPVLDRHPFLLQSVWLVLSLIFALVAFGIGPYPRSMTQLTSGAADVEGDPETSEQTGHYAGTLAPSLPSWPGKIVGKVVSL